MQLQLTITLALIAVAAIIALICDILRAKDARLRQAMAELEASKRSRIKAADERKETTIKREAAPLAARPARPIQRLPQRQSKGEAMKSNTALSEWLIQRAVARATQKHTEEFMAAVPVLTPGTLPGLAPAPDRILKPFAVPSRPVPVSIDAYLWASRIATEPSTALAGRPEMTFELIQGSGPSSKLDLHVPAGMYAVTALDELTQDRKLFTGLVISIALNEIAANQGHVGGNRNEDLMQAIEGFITELLREDDFGCRLNDDEFVLICPGSYGAEAQRRLRQVSERLWDFQLRTLGKISILFSIGGMDVQRESLADAIAFARDRMGQTRRGPGAVSLSAVPQQRIAM